MKNKFLYLCVFAAALFACDKDGDDETFPTQLVETITYDGELNAKYDYDSDERIAKITYYESNRTVIFKYDGSGELISTKSDNGKSIVDNTYVKSGQSITITSIETITNSGTTTTIIEMLDLDSQGRVSKFRYKGEGNYLKYTYDSKGNVIKMEDYTANVLTYVTEFTFDKNPSVCSAWNMPQWYFIYEDIFGIKNNIKTFSDKDFDDNEEGTGEVSITYDDAGYPSSTIESYSGTGKTYTTTYTYIKR